jgi:hypothetical protein
LINTKRYFVLHSGEVISRFDGTLHYINTILLAELYGLKGWQWVDFREWRGKDPSPEEAIHLYPRADGDYKLPQSVADVRRIEREAAGLLKKVRERKSS